MRENQTGARPSVFLRLVPLVAFTVLAGVTLAIWNQQVGHQRSLLRRHTEDVCIQGARRLEVFIESRLKVAAILARRWECNKTRDYSRRRFEAFATLLTSEIPGYFRLRLLPPEMTPGWVFPTAGLPAAGELSDKQRGVMAEARQLGKVVLSSPFTLQPGGTGFLAVLPLQRQDVFLGFFINEFLVDDLVDDCFQQRIRSEFYFTVQDGDEVIYRYAPSADPHHVEDASVSADWTFAVRNRTWQLSVAPIEGQVRFYGWTANLFVPLFGLLLSLGIGLLIHQLSWRMGLCRVARDQAFSEVAQREKTQAALRASEARYRSVFDSATDGLLVLDHQGVIVEANRAVCTLHGHEPGGLLGKPVQSLFGPAHRHLYGEFTSQLSHKGAFHLEGVDVRLDGSKIDVAMRGTGVRFGEEPHIMVILTDISERKRIEQRQTMLSRKVLLAQEDERARLSRELHDELGQLLTAQRLELGWLQKGEREEGRAGALANAVELVENAAATLRRICRGLRPPLLDDLGLEPAVRVLVEEFGALTGLETNLDIQLSEEGAGLSPEIILCAYRILQESLTNVQRHAGAGEVSVSLVSDLTNLTLSVYDSGRGFDARSLNHLKGCGLEGMRERAGLVGGTLEIRSLPGQGTRVLFRASLIPGGLEVK